MFAAEAKLATLFWGAVCLVSVTGLSFHLYFIIKTYLEYKFTESSFERRGKAHFPDISICNMRGVSATNFRAAAQNNKKINAVLQQLNDSQKERQNSFYLTDYVSFLGQDAHKIGHSFEDFVLKCDYHRQPCKKDDFVHFLFPAFVNCYTFVRGRDSYVPARGGLGTGLTVSIYLEPEEELFSSLYSPTSITSHSTGIRFLITPPNYLRTMGYNAYEAGPGFKTSVAFDMSEHKRLPEPYNQCSNENQNTDKGDIPYSFVECRNECIHEATLEECGCTHTQFFVRNMRHSSSCGQQLLYNETKSNAMIKCQGQVTVKTRTTPNYYADNCNCFWSCSDTKYYVTMSQSAWPSKSSWKSFLNTVFEENPNKESSKAHKHYEILKSTNASDEQIFSWVSNHFLRLSVDAKTDLVLVKQETPKYTLTDLLSGIGGCLGLWVGVSVLTLSNIFEHVSQLRAKKRETKIQPWV